ncbi:hypothetical protein BJY01DRAFT_241929 [Aspergillus pseudoustus]|uniref:Uncharacterized protein n=1 Tax=Aspergillus pseudoustus TaxID=1810923 RepID=A0ABR4L352_9EURO
MKLSWIASFALIGTAIAIPAQQAAKLPSGAPCTKDGNMGICESNLCIQDVNASQGKCK